MSLPCFKAYDIRGRMPDELNPRLARLIGRATAHYLGASTLVVGYDIRLSSYELTMALAEGIMDAGCDVLNIGLCGTEEIYFATAHLKTDGGIMVTASHNPADYNGMKLVREGAKPISGDTGLHTIAERVEQDDFPQVTKRGTLQTVETRPAYRDLMLSHIDRDGLKPLKIIVNPGNGCASLALDALQPALPFTFVPVNYEADGTFPNGIPNPLLPENRAATRDAVLASGADLGLAWDGDFDRCFFFDHNGRFIEGYYIVGLLADAFLRKTPGASIIHDPRLIWNTIDLVEKGGGTAVQSKTGHAFIKERMRLENAVYGGEMSAHHYFRSFFFCDSGMLPWLLVTEMICRSGKTLAQLVDERIELFPASGEINRTLADPSAVLRNVEACYRDTALSIDYTDGLSMTFEHWRFNLRRSNTEPVVRLNVESRGDKELMQQKTEEILVHLR